MASQIARHCVVQECRKRSDLQRTPSVIPGLFVYVDLCAAHAREHQEAITALLAKRGIPDFEIEEQDE